MRWLDGIADSMDMGLSKLLKILMTGKSGMLHGTAKSQTQLSDSTELNVTDIFKENKYY